MRRLMILMLLLAVSACSTTHELPTVKNTDPTWALLPDHSDAGVVR